MLIVFPEVTAHVRQLTVAWKIRAEAVVNGALQNGFERDPRKEFGIGAHIRKNPNPHG